MRVCAGLYKSRRVECPEGIRPTTDRVKEAIFSALAMDLHGKSVLDLFAGSGALGIEALSRGAGAVTFVEQDRVCLGIIRKNIETLAAADKTMLVKADVRTFVRTCATAFDLILMDPPYHKGLASQLAPHVYNLVNPGGVLVIEHSPRETLTVEAWKSRIYGDTMITYVTRAL